MCTFEDQILDNWNAMNNVVENSCVDIKSSLLIFFDKIRRNCIVVEASK